LLFLAAPATHAAGDGEAFLTVEEALALAFPGCQVERRTAYLTKEEEARARKLAGVPLETRVVRPYVATREGRLVGTAYFDAHRVRTKNEVLMLVLAPDGKLQRVEVCAFAEPPEYLPRPAFYAQFAGRALDAELDTRRAIRGVAGATLSARAATGCARRTLALHAVLAERERPQVVPAGAALSPR
jgi:hypothetical protein